jgi:hypothetical protein
VCFISRRVSVISNNDNLYSLDDARERGRRSRLAELSAEMERVFAQLDEAEAKLAEAVALVQRSRFHRLD